MVKSKIESYSVVVITCDWLGKKDCKVQKYLVMQPDLYKVVVNKREPNTIKVHALGDSWTKSTNTLSLCNAIKVLCSSCDYLPDRFQEKVLVKTR